MLGANGFIGSRLTLYLASRGWRVDRIVRTLQAPSNHEWAFGETFEIGPHGDALDQALEASTPEIVFNLAASGIGRNVACAELVDGNAGLVARLLDAVDPTTTRRIVHAGSWSQYSIIDPGIDLGDAEPMEPPTPYGAAKVGAELLGRARGAQMGLDFVTLRLFNVYGPGEGPHRLVPYVARNVAAGRAVSLTSGEQVRDFVHIDDVTAAFEHAALLPNVGSPSFNVATGIGTKVRDVASRVVEEVGADPQLLRFGEIDQRRDEPLRVVGDAARFRRATGWQPRISISDGIGDTVRWAIGAGTVGD